MRQTRSPKDNRRAWLIALGIVAAALLVLVGVLWSRQLRRTGSDVTLPPPREETRLAAAGLDRIDVSCTFDPQAASQLQATQTLTLTNRTGQVQPSLVLRSYTGAYLTPETAPNASEELFAASYGDTFSPGGLLIDQAEVDGVYVLPEWVDPDARTVLRLTPDQPWQPGETRTVTLVWHAAIPELASRFGHAGDIYSLGNLFPTPAVWMGDAWDMREVTPVGDPFLAECVNWTVTLTVPAEYTAAAGSYADPTLADGMATYRWEAPAMRDFALVLSRRYVLAAARVGDTQVMAYAPDAALADRMLSTACQALPCFSAKWGEYAYQTLTLCTVDFPYGGMEYPALVMLAEDSLQSDDALVRVISHEVAHQWWGVQVGSDPWTQPWQDETLAVYAWLDYVGETRGQAARESLIQQTLEAAMRVTVPGSVTPASPLDYFSDLDQYSLVVYYRGAGVWTALEKLMGKGALDQALRDYQSQFRFRIASRDDLTRVLSEHAGFDLSALLTDYLDTLIVN